VLDLATAERSSSEAKQKACSLNSGREHGFLVAAMDKVGWNALCFDQLSLAARLGVKKVEHEVENAIFFFNNVDVATLRPDSSF